MQTATIDQHREQMLRHLADHREYEFLTMAEPFLEAVPSDEYVRLMAVRTYVTLGLIRPALDLLENTGDAAATPRELAALREKLLAIEPPPASWDAQTGRFETNLAALTARNVDAAAIRDAWQADVRHYQRFADVNGQHQVRRRDDQGLWSWFPCLRHHETRDGRDPLPDTGDRRFPMPIAFHGIGLGGLFERAYAESLDTFLGFSSAVYLIEPELAVLAVALHLREWSELLSDPRVQLFLGPAWRTRLREHALDAVDVPLPVQALTIGRRSDKPAGAAVVEAVKEAHEARNTIIRDLQAQVAECYSYRTVDHHARRFADAQAGIGAPLRVLATTSSRTTFLQYSMRDALRALESLGCECLLLKERRPFEMLSPARYFEAMLQFEPDLVFVLDHLRAGFGTVLPENLPLLTWDQDQLPHVFTKANVDRIARHDFVAGYSKRRCLELGADPSQLLYCDVPTCPEQFGGPPLSEDERTRYTCDVSYVSHASQTPEAFHQQERERYRDAQTIRLLDTLFEMLPPLIQPHRGPHYALLEVVLREAMQRRGITTLPQDLHDHLVRWYLWRLGDRVFRQEALEWAADWADRNGRTLRIYGNGWEHHPTLSPYAAGPADNGRELVCIYRASRINLQLMPAGFIHQRSLDGLSAGGFFLAREAPFDLRGRRIRALLHRLRELDITTTESLLATTDHTITQTLSELYGPLESHIRSNWPNLCDLLYIVGESTYPDEVFPHFDGITFDSAESFEQRADTFLAYPDRRDRIVAAMRPQVVERFSYRSTMKRLLEGMTAHLTREAEATQEAFATTASGGHDS